MNLKKWQTLQFCSLGLLPVEYAKDFYRFLRYGKGSLFAPLERRLYFDIILTAHTVEKGLSLAKPRPFFGKQNIRLLNQMLLAYKVQHADFAVNMSCHAIAEYLHFHEENHLTDSWLEEVQKYLHDWSDKFKGLDPGFGKVRDVSRVFENIDQRNYGYAEFLQSRFSCRNYDQRPVPIDIIEEVVKTAQQAPSQCNRQSPKVHLYQNQAQIREILNIQGGARGFDDRTPNLFIVTSEITAWSASSSRNQDYVDGSLFAMALLYSLHAKGIAACPLNMACTNSKEKRVSVLAQISSSERIMLMISFGFPESSAITAAPSPRKHLNKTLITH